MENYEGKVAVVTGASSGIGATISRMLVEKGMNVVGLARRLDRLEELAASLEGPGKLHPLKCDLTQEDEILDAFKWTADNLGPVHVLINNAGVCTSGELIDSPSWKIRKPVEVNIIAVGICTREAIKSMRENEIDGQIVNISSTLGHENMYIPEFNIYHATKHALRAMTMSYKFELEQIGSKIRIGCVSPGIVETEFQQSLSDGTQEVLKGIPQLQTEDVANSVLFILSQPAHVRVHDIILYPI